MTLRPDWEAISTVVGTISAVATIAIGWAAFGISRTQTKAALFDRRFKAYRDLAAGIASIQIDGAVYSPTYETIKEAIHLARFLYDGQTIDLLEKIQLETYEAWLKRPLENQGRSSSDYKESSEHMSEIKSLWSSAKPLMEKSL